MCIVTACGNTNQLHKQESSILCWWVELPWLHASFLLKFRHFPSNWWLSQFFVMQESVGLKRTPIISDCENSLHWSLKWTRALMFSKNSMLEWANLTLMLRITLLILSESLRAAPRNPVYSVLHVAWMLCECISLYFPKAGRGVPWG